MKLNYIVEPNDLAGTALPGCGTIHKSEIKDTLTKLSNDLAMSFDFNDYVVGSTGKREYSGDIDLVVDPALWSGTVGEFRQNLDMTFGKHNVARHGAMLHISYPIVGYNDSYNNAKPRTGLVQIDFNFGDAEWDKFYHFSAGENSAYKGAHRNLMISAICSSVNTSLGPNPYPNDIIKCDRALNQPTSLIRWKFGSDGFIRVNRVSQKDQSGNWMKKQKDIVLEGPIKDPQTIRNILFPHDTTAKDLDCLETLIDAVKRNYGMTDQEKIWSRAAYNFYDWPQGRLFSYPPEIASYIPKNDK